MVRRLIILTLALLLLAPPGEAFAHAFGRTYNLPVPFWLYLFGASAVLVVSFVQIGLFVGAGHTLRSYPRFDLLRVGPLRALLTARPLLFALRLLSVTLFVLVILSGLLGQQNTDHNFAPTFVWIIWWVGFSFFTALVGNLWPLVNPWKVIFEWAVWESRRAESLTSPTQLAGAFGRQWHFTLLSSGSKTSLEARPYHATLLSSPLITRFSLGAVWSSLVRKPGYKGAKCSRCSSAY